MKKKSTGKIFKSTKEMDDFLETRDLGKLFTSHEKKVRPKTKKVNLDLPGSILEQIDEVAAKIGISRQPLLKMWIHEKLKEELHVS